MNISSPAEGVACESSESKSDTMAKGDSVLKSPPRSVKVKPVSWILVREFGRHRGQVVPERPQTHHVQLQRVLRAALQCANGTSQSVAQRAHALQTFRPRSSGSAAPNRRLLRRNARAVRHDLLLVQRERLLHVQQPRYTSGWQCRAFPRRSELSNRLPVVDRPIACANLARGVIRARDASCMQGFEATAAELRKQRYAPLPGVPLTERNCWLLRLYCSMLTSH